MKFWLSGAQALELSLSGPDASRYDHAADRVATRLDAFGGLLQRKQTPLTSNHEEYGVPTPFGEKETTHKTRGKKDNAAAIVRAPSEPCGVHHTRRRGGMQAQGHVGELLQRIGVVRRQRRVRGHRRYWRRLFPRRRRTRHL